ncbi:MAG: peptidoglycan DD-metalloendopeptidase family protein [Chloroflexota bacterium]
MRKFISLLLLLTLLSVDSAIQPVAAQASGPVYIVQSGDTLFAIAARFNVSVDALVAANPGLDPNLIAQGQQIIIPGLEGMTGTLDTEIVNFGDSFHSLARRTQIHADMLRKLNRLISPSEFYVGASMIIPKQNNSVDLTNRISPAVGETLLELAVKSNSDPWTLSDLNDLNGTWDNLPGDVLYSLGQATATVVTTGLPSAFANVEITTLPLVQGETGEIIVTPANGVTLDGVLIDKPLNFFPLGDGRMGALQGIHAMLDPGVYPLRLNATLPDGTKQSFEQMMLVASGNYAKEALAVPSELIDPAVADPEDKQVLSIVSPVTAQKLWDGVFGLPVAQPYCIKDWFGIRRSFNGGDYNHFHAGVDYGICSADHPYDIYAAAPGRVIFAGPLTVRGNATFIDHGEGIYTGYFHQEEIYVSVGQQVQAGELIGKIGETGRVTGPHLHWEVWANGVQVNPLDWLNQVYP